MQCMECWCGFLEGMDQEGVCGISAAICACHMGQGRLAEKHLSQYTMKQECAAHAMPYMSKST